MLIALHKNFRPKMNRIIFNSPKPEWSSCMDTCPMYRRAEAPFFADQAKFDEIIEWAQQTVEGSPNFPPNLFLWLPFRNILENGTGEHYTTGNQVDLSFGVTQTKTDDGKNCAIVSVFVKKFTGFTCKVPMSTFPAMCACELKEQMYLQFRGLCPDSNIDEFYVPRNNEMDGLIHHIGLRTSMIDYNKTSNLWSLSEQSKNTIASSKAAFASYGLGSNEWVIENDNRVCSSEGKPYTKTLKLTGCFNGEFTCSDGQCIRDCKN